MPSVIVCVCLLLTAYSVKAQCGNAICLAWQFSEQTLTLTCQIRKAKSRVFFEDPKLRALGDCVPTLPARCHTFSESGKIYQNNETKNFILKLSNTSFETIIGTWKCRHGKRGDVATAQIYFESTYSSPTTQMELTTFYITENRGSIDATLKTSLIVTGSGLAVLAIIAIACVVYVVNNCQRKETSMTRRELTFDISMTDRAASNIHAPEDRESDYTSINENEMIDSANTDFENAVYEESVTKVWTSSNSSSITVDSKNPYLEVIDDF